MSVSNTNPMQALWNWFSALPVQHREFLATLYWTLTTDDTSEFGLSPAEYVHRFAGSLQQEDFPLRTMSRLVMIRSMVDFILRNRMVLQDKALDRWAFEAHGQGKVIHLAEEQWKSVVSAWYDLRTNELSDDNLSRWTRAVLKT